LARNNFVSNNFNVTEIIKNTKFEKGKILDKILVIMIKNCLDNLKSGEVNSILSTNNIIQLKLPQEKYLTFNPEVLQTEPVFNSEELSLLKTIYGVIYINFSIKKKKRLKKKYMKMNLNMISQLKI
jgi:hypothetical protein